MFMRKFCISTLALVGLLGGATISQAQVVTYQLLTPLTVPPTANPFLNPLIGVKPTTITNFAGAPVVDPLLFNFLAPIAQNPQSYATPSVLQYGNDMTTAGVAPLSNKIATFNMVPISYDFQLAAGPNIAVAPHTYTAFATLNGPLGYDQTGTPFSQATLIYSQIRDNTTGQVSTLGVDPNNGLTALTITSLLTGGPLGPTSVTIWLDQTQSKPIPNKFITQTGFIRAQAIPEPGSVALLSSFGVCGTIFGVSRLRRRRK